MASRLFGWVRWAALAAFAPLLAVHYGQRGFLPLDHSIVFAGGDALACGRVPFADPAAPAGLPLFLVQRGLFALFGVDWFAYLLHGALLNATAALLVYALLCRRYPSPALPLLAAAATAVVFLPPIGTPYPDHGSLLFSVLALSAADAIRNERARALPVLPLLAGASLGLAFSCKPIPAVFFLPLVVVMLAARAPRGGGRWRTLGGFAVGGLAGLAGALLGAGVGLRDDALQWVPRLLVVGQGRFAHLVANDAHHLREVVAPAWAIPLLLWSLVWLVCAEVERKARSFESALDVAAPADRFLSAGIVAASLLYAGLTFRSGWTSLGGYPLALGLAWAPVARRRARHQDWRGERLRGAGAVGALVLVGALGWLAYFQLAVNEPRAASLLDLRGRLAPQPVPPGLEWLDPETPSFTSTDGAALTDVVAYLRDRPGRFFLLGDSSVIYGLAGKCSPSPVLWFHPHLTVPWRGASATVDFQERLIASLERSGVTAVVVENGGTQMGVTPDTLPLVRDWVAARATGERTLGSFQVFSIAPAAP